MVFVTHQVEFLPAADLILVRKKTPFSRFYYTLTLAILLVSLENAKESLIGVFS